MSSENMLKAQIIELMKDPELKIVAKNFVLDLAKNEEIEFVEDLSGNKKVQLNVVETLSSEAKQSFKNLPKCACGASVGVGPVIAGMAVLKTSCRARSIPEPPENQPW